MTERSTGEPGGSAEASDSLASAGEGVSSRVADTASGLASQANDVLEDARDQASGIASATSGVEGDFANRVEPLDPGAGADAIKEPESIDDALRLIGTELGRVRDGLGAVAGERFEQAKPELMKAADGAKTLIDNAAEFARDVVGDLKKRLEPKD